MGISSRIKLRYHKRLFLWLILYSLLIIVLFVGFQYSRERQFKAEELNFRLQLINDEIIDYLNETGVGEIDSLAVHSTYFPDLRISVISREGKVLYDNSLDSLPASDHRSRREIADALANGDGYSLRRHSESTGGTYFYSAKAADGYVVRSAIPYSVSLVELLRADFGFLWFMGMVAVVMCILGYYATRRVGLHVSRLRDFAMKAERGDRISETGAFPHDELGDISNHIVRLYSRLQETTAERDREHRLAIHEEQEKIRIKKQLTNNINHELKTPIASVRACVETLIDHPELDAAKRSEFLERSLWNLGRLNRLMADVSTITRLEDGSTAISRDPLDLREVIGEVVADTIDNAEAKGFAITFDGPERIKVAGNESLLYSVFYNLIDNAIAYSGGDRVEITCRELGDGYVIEVADNGSGVEAKHLPRLFERFYRVDKGRSRQAGGTGLGLAIVKNSVTVHGGTISVENRPGSGLCFRISLPKG